MSSDNQQLEQDGMNKRTELSTKLTDIDATDAVMRLERSRERNREHARKTRLRKKARLQALQSRLIDLQQEHSVLKQNVEESNIASILLNLSSVSEGNPNSSSDPTSSQLKSTEPSESVNTSNVPTNNISNDNLSNKTEDANSADKIESKENSESEKNISNNSSWRKEMKLLSAEEIESTRRERNRLHAKMTRERKKMLISRLEQSVKDLEKENLRLRSVMPNNNPQQLSTSQNPLRTSAPIGPYGSIIASSTSINTQQIIRTLNNGNQQPYVTRPTPPDASQTTEGHRSEHGEETESERGLKLVA